MSEKEPVLISWSGGKDSMMALHEIRAAGELDVVAGLTTVTQEYGRICMHGVRREILHQQAKALRLPVEEIVLPYGPSNADYEKGLSDALARWKAKGIRRIIFGDIFLEDLKIYRDKFLAERGMSGIYPLWKRDTRTLAKQFIDLGYTATLVCVDTHVLAAE